MRQGLRRHCGRGGQSVITGRFIRDAFEHEQLAELQHEGEVEEEVDAGVDDMQHGGDGERGFLDGHVVVAVRQLEIADGRHCDRVGDDRHGGDAEYRVVQVTLLAQPASVPRAVPPPGLGGRRGNVAVVGL